ncbi:MAG: hypothetical protein M1834_003413 [Cirrosporium novae-zelandiae]|nr:MAG: hypothetical protein M1834_003413 [Cirrosporium novae-zelandiae]
MSSPRDFRTILNAAFDEEGDATSEEDDDDMEYQPTNDESDNEVGFYSHELQDDDDGLNNIEIELSLHEGSSDEDDEHPQGEHTIETVDGQTHTMRIPPRQIIQYLLSDRGSSLWLGGTSVEPEDEGSESNRLWTLRPRQRRSLKSGLDKYPKVPSDIGRNLMNSGQFGNHEYYRSSFKNRRRKLATKLMWRELGYEFGGKRKRESRILVQDLIPSSNADTIIYYDSRCYSGQFSDDGNFFFCCAQDFRVRMYDTSNPYDWKYYKTVDYPYGHWTITDATLSPDNKYLAYSSIRSIVCLAPTDPEEHRDPHHLDFSDLGTDHGHRGWSENYDLGIWSIRFSGDGREIVAGTSDHSVYVYDIEAQQSILRINGHSDDVNAVCYGDSSSPHILYSGSDDTTIKVWDRRSMGDSREAGVFLGHTEGLTYVDSKGDGRYVLSNGKDQTMKLWDLRKMMSTNGFDKVDPQKYTTGFDYRFMKFDEEIYEPHPYDSSLVTFRGHKVLRTLIRCHFSPPGSTNSRYVYTGSEDGSVYVYNLDGTLAKRIDVKKATAQTRPRNSDIMDGAYHDRARNQSEWKTCVRDVSWHPNAPVIAATSWNGWGGATGTCTLHSYNDGIDNDDSESKMGLRLNPRLQHDESLYDPISLRRGILRSRRVAITLDEEDEDEW